jgi:hypothetical protein
MAVILPDFKPVEKPRWGRISNPFAGFLVPNLTLSATSMMKTLDDSF